jgi:hypothetical protein
MVRLGVMVAPVDPGLLARIEALVVGAGFVIRSHVRIVVIGRTCVTVPRYSGQADNTSGPGMCTTRKSAQGGTTGIDG